MSQATTSTSTGNAVGTEEEQGRLQLINNLSYALYQLFGSTQFVEHLNEKPTRNFNVLKPCSQVSHGYVLDECVKAMWDTHQKFGSTVDELLLAADKAFDTRLLLNVGITLSELWKLPRYDPRRRDDHVIRGPTAQDLLHVPADFKIHFVPFTKSPRDLASHIEDLSSEDAFFISYKKSTAQLETLCFATTRSQCFIVDACSCSDLDLDKISIAVGGAICGKFGITESGSTGLPATVEQMIRNTDDICGFIAEMFKQESTEKPYEDLVHHVLGKLIPLDVTESSWRTRPFSIRQVLEWPVWLCILGAYLFTSILLWVFDRFSPYSYRNNKEKYANDTEKREFTLKECLWFCMTSLTPQGGGEAPKNVSGRLVAATWWLFGFIIIASYTANLAAFLTVSRIEQQITSLDDLAKQYKTAYAPMKGGGTETYFRRMAEIEEQFYNIWKQMSLNESMNSRDRAKLAVWDYPVSDKYTNMWRFMQESKLPNSIDEAIQRVLDSPDGKGFAFIGDAMEIKYAQLTNCKLQMIGTEFSRKPYAIAVQSGHPMKDKISQTILKLLNQRSLEQLKEKWWHQNPKRQECPNAEDDSTGISIQNIGGVFIVILAGIVISLIILVFEYFYYKKKDAAAQKEVGNGKVTTANSEQNHHHSFMITTPDDEPENVVRSRRNPHNGTNGEEQSARNGGVFHYQNSAFEF